MRFFMMVGWTNSCSYEEMNMLDEKGKKEKKSSLLVSDLYSQFHAISLFNPLSLFLFCFSPFDICICFWCHGFCAMGQLELTSYNIFVCCRIIMDFQWIWNYFGPPKAIWYDRFYLFISFLPFFLLFLFFISFFCFLIWSYVFISWSKRNFKTSCKITLPEN